MKYEIIIFDLDGTLINSLEDLKDSVNYMLYEFEYSKKTLFDVRNAVGNGVEKLVERMIPDGIENPNYEKCLKIFRDHYSKNMDKKTVAYPYIMEMLETLQSKGYKIAVVSNKFDTAVKPLCKKYFDGLVNIAIGQSKDMKKKPEPDTVFLALQHFQSTPEKAVFVGDSEVDIQTAQNANMDCISVSWGYRSKNFLTQNNAKIIIDKPLDIFEHI